MGSLDGQFGGGWRGRRTSAAAAVEPASKWSSPAATRTPTCRATAAGRSGTGGLGGGLDGASAVTAAAAAAPGTHGHGGGGGFGRGGTGFYRRRRWRRGGGGGGRSPGAGGGGGFGGGGGWGLGGGGGGGFGGGGAAPGSAASDGAPATAAGAADPGPARGGGGAGIGGAMFNIQGEVTVINSTIAGNSAAGGAAGRCRSGQGHGRGGLQHERRVHGHRIDVRENSASDHAATRSTTWSTTRPRRALAQATLRNTIVAHGDRRARGPRVRTGATTISFTARAAPTPRSASATSSRTPRRSRRDPHRSADHRRPPASGPRLERRPHPDDAAGEGSPALDAGSAFGLTTDQRGLAGPSTYPRRATSATPPTSERWRWAPSVRAATTAAASPASFGSNTLVTSRPPSGSGDAAACPWWCATATSSPSPAGCRAGGARRRSGSRPLNIAAKGRETVRLRLPRAIRRILIRRGRVTLRLTAKVRDPAGNSRRVSSARHGEAEGTGTPLTHC